ncbi:hypothetical protein [Mesorhizobium sp.]|uniref:hypothetical protein n=1 Tax=Mesorhizobium sp. TaxID=1871066 RepID=UPI00257CA38B|nr:hypothetical protein [Mesorhizobium sp.]
MRAGERAMMLLREQRHAAIGGRVGDMPAGLPVEPEAAGGRSRIGCEKTILDEDGILFVRRFVSDIVRVLSPAIVLACAVEGKLVARRVAQRCRQARSFLSSLQKCLAALAAAYDLQHRRIAGRTLVRPLRQDTSEAPIRWPLGAPRIDATPDAGNGPFERVEPDRREALFLKVGRLSRRTRHRKDKIGRANAIRLRRLVEVCKRHAAVEQSLDETPGRRVAAEHVVELRGLDIANIAG